MRKICVIAPFDFKNNFTGGQSVKSRELYSLLEATYGCRNVYRVETFNWKHHPLNMLFNLLKTSLICDTFIMLPAYNGIKVFSKILYYIKKLGNKKIYYDVIGGWLPELLKNNPHLKRYLIEFDGIWLETTSMYQKLTIIGFKNLKVIENFKSISILEEKELVHNSEEILKVCIFSRINEKKGIVDAVLAINEANKYFGKDVYQLDIYGPVEKEFQTKFEKLLIENSNIVHYGGKVPPSKSVETIKNYFALLFPTKYYTEGIPGTIIDAYSAGVPVITSMWENYQDIFYDGYTGLGYEFDNNDEFIATLIKAVNNKKLFYEMKFNCLEIAKRYQPEIILNKIIQEIG